MVLDLLCQRPHRAGELAAAMHLSPPAMSRHLRVLRRSGLVEEERLEEDARVRMFRLRREPFDALGAWVGEMQSFWDDQLASFQQAAERRAHSERRPGRRRRR